jgi:solute carrier family 25 S-adenosylmethionine transporter 26
MSADIEKPQGPLMRRWSTGPVLNRPVTVVDTRPTRPYEPPGASSQLMTKLPSHLNGVAGGLAGCASTALLFPLDTLKTWRMARPHGEQLPRWTFWCVYRGLSTKVFFRLPYQLTYQTVYSISTKQFEKRGISGPASFAISGMCAELGGCVFRMPMEVIKQRVQTQVYSGLYDGLSQISKQEGLWTFYRRIFVPQTVMYDLPWSIVVWVIYENTMNFFGDRAEFSPTKSLTIGALSGAIAGMVTCPADIIRTRILSVKPTPGQPLASISSTIQSIYATEGGRYFFRGVIPRVAYIVPSHGSYMMYLEAIRSFMIRNRGGGTSDS